MLVKISSFYVYLCYSFPFTIYLYSRLFCAQNLFQFIEIKILNSNAGYKFRYCTLDCVITRTCAEVPNRSAGGLKQASQARAEESVEGASVEERLKVFLYETFSRFLPFIFMFRSKFSR